MVVSGRHLQEPAPFLTVACPPPHSLQVLRWSFLALRGDFNVNLAMIEEPQKMQIRTEMLQVGTARTGMRRSGPGRVRTCWHTAPVVAAQPDPPDAPHPPFCCFVCAYCRGP